MERTPPSLKPYVIAFCDDVLVGGKPVYIPVEPATDAPINHCFTVVPEHVARHGGVQVIGWRIREWPHVLMQAEFHAVWKSPENRVVDVNPNDFSATSVLFIADHDAEPQPILVDNIRKPLMRSDDVKEFCRLSAVFTRERNKTYCPDKNTCVFTARMLQIVQRMEDLRAIIERKRHLRRRHRRSN